MSRESATSTTPHSLLTYLEYRQLVGSCSKTLLQTFRFVQLQTAHSIELAASQPGHLKETKILTLLPVKESVEAMHEASKQEYPAPKGWLERAHSELWGG
jgi:hypothetical protein